MHNIIIYYIIIYDIKQLQNVSTLFGLPSGSVQQLCIQNVDFI